MRFFLLLIGAISVLASDCVGKTTRDSCHEGGCKYDEDNQPTCFDPCQDHQDALDAANIVTTDETDNVTFTREEENCVNKGCQFSKFASDEPEYTCALACSSVCAGEDTQPVCACTRDYVSKCMALCSGFKEPEIRTGLCDDVYITSEIEQICEENNAFPNWYTMDIVLSSTIAGNQPDGFCPPGPHGVFCVKPSLIHACPNYANNDSVVCAKAIHQTYQFSNPCMAIGAGFMLKDKVCSGDDECPHGDCVESKCFSKQDHYYVSGFCNDVETTGSWIPAYAQAAMRFFGTSPIPLSIALRGGSPFGINVQYFDESDNNIDIKTEGLEDSCGCDHNEWNPVCLRTGLLSFSFSNQCVADCRKKNQGDQWSQVYWPDDAVIIQGECVEPCVSFPCDDSVKQCVSQGETIEGEKRHKCMPKDQAACNDACFQIAQEAVGGRGKVLCTPLFKTFVESKDPDVGDYCASVFVSKKQCPNGCTKAPEDSVAICYQSLTSTPCRATLANNFDNDFTDVFSKDYGNDKVCVSQWLRKDTEWFYMRNKCQAVECLGFYPEQMYDGPCDQRCIELGCTEEERNTDACVYTNATQQRETVTLCEAKCRTDDDTAYYVGICARDDCIKRCPIQPNSTICIDGTISQNSVCEATCAGIIFDPLFVTPGLCPDDGTFDCAPSVEGEASDDGCCDLISTEVPVDRAGRTCSDYRQGAGLFLFQLCTIDAPSPNTIQLLKQDGYLNLPDDVKIADVCPFSCSTCVEPTACSETNLGCCDLLTPLDIQENSGLNEYATSCKSYKDSGNLEHCVKADGLADAFKNNNAADSNSYEYQKFEVLMAILRPDYEQHYYFEQNNKLLARHVCRESCGQCACDPLIPGCCDIVLKKDTYYMVSAYGDCQSYQAGGINEGKCSEHDALTEYQSGRATTVGDVCRVSCKSCRDCVSDGCCNVKPEFDLNGYGNCSKYDPGSVNSANLYCAADKVIVNGEPTETLIKDVCQIECNSTCKAISLGVKACEDNPFHPGYEGRGCSGYEPGGLDNGYCAVDNACGALACPCPVACLKDATALPFLPSTCQLAVGAACSDTTYDCAGVNNWCYEGTCQELIFEKCEDNPAFKGYGDMKCDTYAVGGDNADYCVQDGACVDENNCPCPYSCQDDANVLRAYQKVEDYCEVNVDKCVDNDAFFNRWSKNDDGNELGCAAYSKDRKDDSPPNYNNNFDYCKTDRVIRNGKCPITCVNPGCLIVLGGNCTAEYAIEYPDAKCMDGLVCTFGRCTDPNVIPCIDSDTWESKFGNCATYEVGHPAANHNFCSLDKAIFQGACPVACNNPECVYPDCGNDGCCDLLEAEDKFNSETSGCGAYKKGFGNEDYCFQDTVQEDYLAALSSKYFKETFTTALTAGDVCKFSCDNCNSLD